MANSRSWWSKDTVAVVTGANQGIGYETVRQLAREGLTVVLTARDPSRGQTAVDAIKAEGLESVVFHPLDICSSESVEKLATWLKHEFGGIDILVNNAGALFFPLDYETAKKTVDTNYYGTVKVIDGLLPLLRASPSGARIVTVSSRAGLYERLELESLREQFRDESKYNKEFADSMVTKFLEDYKAGRQFEEGWISAMRGPMYSESKMFLNIYLAGLAKSLSKSQPENHQVFVLTFCPGVTVTTMHLESMKHFPPMPEGVKVNNVAEGADTGIWLALLPKDEILERNGKFFGERKEMPLNSSLPF